VLQTLTPPDVQPFSGQFTDTDRNHFREKGYLAWNKILSDDEVAEARAGISEIINEHAFNDARSTYRAPGEKGKASFKSRSTRMEFETERGYEPHPDRNEELELKVRKLMWFENDAPIFKKIAFEHPNIRKVLDGILGEDFRMFQSMALIKPPFVGSAKPWHQDNAYFAVTPLDAIVGVWIALDHATVENGCMHLIEGGHKLGAFQHHHDKDCEIEAERFISKQVVPVELEPGGALFFYGMLPHQTPPNESPDRRRALQFHYHSARARKIDPREYDQVFAETDGTPASCAAARAAGI